ncbi:amidohydrolase family protein [Nocardia sp. NPDC052278]|uniref:amidohydrolase family protein n=1 Tax=unclassified Nocardia TaxID=2637762 RepID=UPI0036A91CCD
MPCLVEAFAHRLIACPMLPTVAPDEAATFIGSIDAPAVIWFLRPDGPLPDDPAWRSVLQALQEKRTALFLHPGVEPVSALFEPWGLSSAMSAPVLTSVAVMRLILSGTCDSVPDLSIVVPHAGGVIPFLIARLEDQTAGVQPGLLRDILSRFTYDSACFDSSALGHLRRILPEARIQLGSDAPFRGPITRARRVHDRAKAGA